MSVALFPEYGANGLAKGMRHLAHEASGYTEVERIVTFRKGL